MHARNAAALAAAGATRAGPGHATVDLISVDEDAERLIGTAAAYERCGLPYAEAEAALRREGPGPAAAEKAAAEAGGGRRWRAEPPHRALGAFRMQVEIVCSALSWRVLATTAHKAGATVLLQPAGTACSASTTFAG